MNTYTRPFSQIGSADIEEVGGKGANLGELTKAGFAVPVGFCVTTSAYNQFAGPKIALIGAILSTVRPNDLRHLSNSASRVRALLEDLPVPSEVEAAVIEAREALGGDATLAVRSSATAEDLPTASFAGQQDTFLNVRGRDDLIDKVKACWVSLFTDRAILYRIQQGIDHAVVSLSVVVQEMVASEVSGILFTADPVSGRRSIMSIDAGFGLGEALVSGVVTADLYQIDKHTKRIAERRINPKTFAIESLPGGGTHRVDLDGTQQERATLNDGWVHTLTDVGIDIEAHFGTPQDVEWAIAEDKLYILQSRPITTLFPLPELPEHDPDLHVYISVSHFQVMTDPIPPLAMSVVRTIMPFDHPSNDVESRTFTHAGGRLYIDVTPAMNQRVLRRVLPRALRVADERFSIAIRELAQRPDLWHGRPLRIRKIIPGSLPILARALRVLVGGKTSGIATETLDTIDHEVAFVRQRLTAPENTPDRMRVLLDEIRSAFDPIFRWAPQAVAGVMASRLVDAVMGDHGDPNDLVAAQRGLEGNVATEMNLAVGDLADTARLDSDLVSLLQSHDIKPRQRLAEAAALPGGKRFVTEWDGFINRYGARGPSEIDLSRPRWNEDPSSLLQMVINNLSHAEPQSHRRHFEELHRAGIEAADRLAADAGGGIFGWLRRPVARRLLRVSRDLSPMREHHKYFVIRLLSDMKQILIEAGEDLVSQGELDAADDIWYLTLPEVFGHYGVTADTGSDLRVSAAERRETFAYFDSLNPPRVMTSDGEIPVTRLNVDAPPNALVGTAVSAGVIEGLARVITDPAAESLSPGEILVAPFTDPGWTPLFVNAAGLVTEVGGLMTHGSVVAREYGIPAVVGVEGATTEITTGQRIRIDGDVGYVEVLSDEPTP